MGREKKNDSRNGTEREKMEFKFKKNTRKKGREKLSRLKEEYPAGGPTTEWS
jgi:ribosomal protein L21E